MKLSLRKSSEDWFVIERAEHEHKTWVEPIGPNAAALRDSSRFSDADVEGTKAEMLLIADAIQNRKQYGARRCAVRVVGNVVFFSSPRNSQVEGQCSLQEADDLAAEILNQLGQ